MLLATTAAALLRGEPQQHSSCVCPKRLGDVQLSRPPAAHPSYCSQVIFFWYTTTEEQQQQQLSNVYRDTQAQGVVGEISVRTQASIYSRRPPAQTNWLRVVLFKMGRRNFKQTFSFFNSQVQRDIRVAGAHSTCCWTVGKATAADRCQPWKDWNPPGLWVAAGILSLLCLNIVWTLLFKGGDNILFKEKWK
jgi:hypothetical protein